MCSYYVTDIKEIPCLLFYTEQGIFLTESSKSPASIARSNKQWVGLACIRRGTSPS